MSQPQSSAPTAGATPSGAPSSAPAGGFPKFISESRVLEPRGVSSPKEKSTTPTVIAVSSSSGSGGSVKATPSTPPPPLNLCIVINICHYITPLAKLIIMAQPLESIANEIDREAFLALQSVLKQLDSGKSEPINIFPFLDKICHFMNTSLNDFEEMDISFVWDNVVKLITLVIPPLRALFLGRRSLSLDEHAWISLISRCIHAQFAYPVQSLEDFIKLTLSQQEGFYYNNAEAHHRHRSPLESIKNFNAIILSRLPDVLAFAVESGHLPPSLRFLDALSKNPARAKPPVSIKFPQSFTLPVPSTSKEAKGEDEALCTYELVSVVTLEGSNFDIAQAYYRYASDRSTQWFKGVGATHDMVDSNRAIDKNYLHTADSRKVHPRLLIYAKKGISQVMQNLQDFVTKGGQLRSLGDATFEAAETPEHYDEARQYYEDAIAQDESLRAVLQEKLDALDQIERNQKAQSYENQADQSLGKKRFKEACDLYKLAIRSAVVNSPIYNRIREKEDYMMRIISLEIANHLTEKGEECLKGGLYAQSRENFAQALKLNPNYVHLHSIISGIEKVITAQTSAQKVTEANQAMKVGRYKYANQLFLEAVSLVPERESSLKAVLESLVVLMQGEDALMKQRSGLMALEDKKYAQAIQLITEAIGLLPDESVTEHAFFLCDRAQVYFEMKEYQTSIEDCHEALELRPELAIAYFRLGSAQFELELYDEALVSYDKALRIDGSMADQVKVKVRQVNTAKEIQQRKERETERARAKEEERKRIDEKKVRDEKVRKERAEKLAQEQAEKSERLLMAKEEKLMMTFLNRGPVDGKVAKAKAAVVPKEKTTKDKVEKLAEKERLKAEKEREKERVKAEKEAKLRGEQEAKEQELQRQRDFAAEMEKAAAKLRDADREKELERERVRIENERIIAERDKQRQEREKSDVKKGKSAESKAAAKESEAKLAASKKKGSPTVPVEFPSLAAGTKTAVDAKGAPGKPLPGKPAPASRSASTPVATTKWSSLLTVEEPVPAPAPPKAPVVPPKPLAPVEDFPPLNDATAAPVVTPMSGPTVASIVAQGAAVSTPSSATTQTTCDSATATASPIQKPLSTENVSVAAALSTSAPASAPAQGPSLAGAPAQAPPLAPAPTKELLRSVSEPVAAPVASVGISTSSGGGQAQPKPKPKPSPKVTAQMPALAAAYPGSGLQEFSSWDTVQSGDHEPALAPSHSALPPPGIQPISPRGDLSSKEDVSGFYTLSSTASTASMGLSGSLLGGVESTGNDLLSLLKGQDASSAPYQPFAIGRASSGTLDSSLGLGTPLSGGQVLGDLGDSHLPGSIGRPPSLSSMSGFGEGSSGGFLSGLGPLGLGLEGIDNGEGRNSSRLSHLFGGAGPGAVGAVAEQSLGDDLFPSLGGFSSLEGGSSTFGLFGLESSLGGARDNSPSNVFNRSGLFGDADANQTSRLDKIFAFNNNNTTTSANGFMMDAALTPNRPVGLGIAESSGLLGANPLPGLSSSFWMDPSSSGSTFPNLSSLLSSANAPTGRMDLAELGKRPEDELLSDASFPTVSWLRAVGVQFFRWAMHGNEWAEYGMLLPRGVLQLMPDPAAIFGEIGRVSGCDIRLVDVTFNGQSEKAAIFVRGTVGSLSNRAMDHALEQLNGFLIKLPGLVALVQQAPSAASALALAALSPAGRWGASLNPFDSVAGKTSSSADVLSDSMVEALISGALGEDKKMTVGIRPALLKIPPHPSGLVRRYLEIPADLIGLVIGAGGKKIKELGAESACRVQFKTSKASEKEGKPGVLELQGTNESMDKALNMVWELVQSVGREYREVSVQQARR